MFPLGAYQGGVFVSVEGDGGDGRQPQPRAQGQGHAVTVHGSLQGQGNNTTAGSWEEEGNEEMYLLDWRTHTEMCFLCIWSLLCRTVSKYFCAIFHSTAFVRATQCKVVFASELGWQQQRRRLASDCSSRNSSNSSERLTGTLQVLQTGKWHHKSHSWCHFCSSVSNKQTKEQFLSVQ